MQDSGLAEVESVFVVGDEHDLKVARIPDGEERTAFHPVECDAVDGGARVVDGQADARRQRGLVQRHPGQVIHAQAKIESARTNGGDQKIEAELTVVSG